MRLITILLLVPASLFAQIKASKSFNYDSGQGYPFIDSDIKFFSKIDTANCIFLKQKGANVILQKYNTLDKKVTVKNSYSDFPANISAQGFLELNGDLFFIYQAFNSKNKLRELFARKVNKKDAAFYPKQSLLKSNKSLLSIEQDALGFEPIAPIFDADYAVKDMVLFKMNISQNNKFFAVMFRERDSGKNEKWSIHVFNDSLNEIWKSNIIGEINASTWNNFESLIDNNGNVHFLQYNTANSTLTHNLFRKDSNVQSTSIPYDKSYQFQRIKMLETSGKQISITGFYGVEPFKEKSSFGQDPVYFDTKGMMFYTLDLFGNVIFQKEIPFDDELTATATSIDPLTKPFQILQPKNDLADLKITLFKEESDSTFLIIGEQQYVQLYSEFINNFRNIVICKINSKGETLWIHKIPKFQTAITHNEFNPFVYGQLSHYYAKGLNNHFLFFIDNPKNEGIETGLIPYEHKNEIGGFIAGISINDKTGELVRHTLSSIWNLDKQRAYYDFNITNFFDLDNNTFYLEIHKKYQNKHTAIHINWIEN